MVIARNKAINAALCQQFSQRAVSKVYSALLCGHLADDEGTIDAPIAKDPALFPLMTICPRRGKPARSGYRVVERLRYQGSVPVTRVQLTPKPAAPISCVFTASGLATLFWAAICTAVCCFREQNRRRA
jgi:tRNA pseudouridine32 synthase/23S rRNA pseudouridine746 synthase